MLSFLRDSGLLKISKMGKIIKKPRNDVQEIAKKRHVPNFLNGRLLLPICMRVW